MHIIARCSSDTQYEVTATLTGCSDEQFTCRKDLFSRNFSKDIRLYFLLDLSANMALPKTLLMLWLRFEWWQPSQAYNTDNGVIVEVNIYDDNINDAID